MEIYEDFIKTKEGISKYFNENSICFLDIETTGFSRKYNQIYLIGLVYFNVKNNSWCLSQMFANHIDEEKELLEKFNDFISNFNLIITYNGDSFDLPFIKHRSENYGIDSKILNIDSFDIYRKVKNNSSYIHLKNLKLKTIEQYLGIYREDRYSGKDCIDFYYQYMRTSDITIKEKILKHNYDDLYYLLDILKIFDLIKDIKSKSIAFNGEKIDVEIKDMLICGDMLRILCNTSEINEHINFVYYENNFNINWQDTRLIIDLEVKEGFITPTKKCLFINKSSIPLNTNLKDLSQYVAPNNIILLKIEDKYEVQNILNIIETIILYII